MTNELDDDIFDDLFHGAAWAAFVELTVELGHWPDSETTRRRAFRLYEEALASRVRNRHSAESVN